ncbi:MAG: DUF3427 domain-containing protein [Acidothermaceae bacterium]
MDELAAGLYEVLLDETLGARLTDLEGELVDRVKLRPADAADRIALHLARQIERAVDSIPEENRVASGIEIARKLFAELIARAPRALTETECPVEGGEVLHALNTWNPDGSVRKITRPLIPLLDTTLLTNAPGEPRVGNQIHAEIESADALDVVMAFVRQSGLRPIASALEAHCAAGRPLRVLTTTYTGSTERKALDLLHDLGADVRVSYDIATTRLHAKAWLFHRHSGFSTAYVGSSNLTHSAQIAGMEWNVRVSGARNRDVVEKIKAVFDSYWHSGDFLPYTREEFDAAIDAGRRGSSTGGIVLSPIEIRLEPFQDRLLELIAVAREQGHHRNLLVSATGTGKTVMAAIDYARLRAKLPRARLLFVAHREEILDQSLATFRHAMRDHAFGEKWVGGERPRQFDHVFASVQSLNAAGLDRLEPDHFDVVIVDEFHHAAAPSYRALLDHVRPVELLGLTATPERSDRLPILHWFGDRIAAELRLWDAIDQHRLSPFSYYGIHDSVDLQQVPWKRGQGYDVNVLTAVYTANDAWARLVLHQVIDHVDDISAMRCLGFCVSVGHARFMAAHFNAHGVPAVAVWGDSLHAERIDALRGLADGRIKAVFSVDLFNEGIDVPAVDVVLMLRPTDSATLFLQQLGRGLRTAPGKTVCTVLDFIGQHRKEFRFDRRYRALLGGTRRGLERAVETRFPFLPAGCHMELDQVASSIVLRNVRLALPSNRQAKIDELRSLGGQRGDVTLANFLDETGLDLADLYAGGLSWSELREVAGLPVAAAGPRERDLRRAIGRMQHVDDLQRADTYAELLGSATAPDLDRLTEIEQRLVRMLVVGLGSTVIGSNDSLKEAVDLIWSHPQVITELGEVVNLLSTRIDHLQQPARPDLPLQIHARYTRAEILAAIDEGEAARTPPWREGVRDATRAGADILAFTLDKTSGNFSPTTRYRDYAISRELIHWESQSTTRADSPTGRRYQNHVAMDRSILLFARARSDDRAFWFLGPATYVSHEGERPMAVTWRLHTPLPGDLFATFAAAVA